MYIVGVDLGGTNIKAGIIDEKGCIVTKSSIPTGSERGYAAVIADMGAQINELIRSCGIEISKFKGIGIGSPGAINSKTGTVDYSNNLKWNHVPLADELARYVSLPVKVSNDANVAALGETLFGSGKEYSTTILLTLGTGVGGGIVLDNKLFEGNESKGAELGHSVVEVDGEECTCGRKGCLEAYASATALIKSTKKAMEKDKDSMMWSFAGSLDKVDGRTAFECSKNNDRSAVAVVNRYVKYLAEGILNFGNIFRPEAIILGGGVCAQGEYLLSKIKAYVEKNQYGFSGCPHYDLVIASLGNDAGIIGAASLFI